MSIAGFVGEREDGSHLSASLKRLAWSAEHAHAVHRWTGGGFGVTNGSALWNDGTLAVAFDGVLFEREETAALTGLTPAMAKITPAFGLEQQSYDAALIAAAYRRWGDGFPDKLDGEYAFALWDVGKQILLLGSDSLQGQPLHYGEASGTFCFASEQRGLVGWPGIDSALDEEMVARMLSVQPALGRTLFRGVRALGGGHTLTLPHGGPPRTVRYWHPLNIPELRLKDTREYADALRSTLQHAVKRRLPSTGLVGSHLSSGFDSSGITALVAQELARQNRPLVSYTSVPVHQIDASEVRSNRFGDEWPLASRVAAMYPNVEHVRISTGAVPWWEAIDTLADGFSVPFGFIRNARWYYSLGLDAQRRGIGTMFGGASGNLTSSYDGSFALYHMWRRRRFFSLYKSLRRRRQRGEAWRVLLHSTFLPSSAIKLRIKRLMGAKTTGFYELSLMRPEFFAASHLPGGKYSPMGQMIAGDRRNGRTWRYSIIKDAYMGMAVAGDRRLFGIRRADPTADRRILELTLSIPDEVFRPNDVPRDLYRQAMQNDLPPELLAESRRGLQGSDFLELFAEGLDDFQAEVRRLEEMPLACRIFDLPRMRGMLDSFSPEVFARRGAADQMFDYTFGGAISLARFIRRNQERGSFSAAL